MKKLLLALAAFIGTLLFSQAQSQSTTGSIIYENKINLHRRLTGDREAMKAMLPEFRTTRCELLFEPSATLFKNIIEDEDESFGSGGGMTIRMNTPQSEFYFDMSSRVVTRLQEFMGKNYLVEDGLIIQPWKMGEETREILGYVCRMAYYTDTTNNAEITAWYTMELPPFMGPENFNTLPGTVLALDVNNGERLIIARSVEFRELKKNELKKPEKGEKMTKEEYAAMVEEQLEKMQKARGGLMIRN